MARRNVLGLPTTWETGTLNFSGVDTEKFRDRGQGNQDLVNLAASTLIKNGIGVTQRSINQLLKETRGVGIAPTTFSKEKLIDNWLNENFASLKELKKGKGNSEDPELEAALDMVRNVPQTEIPQVAQVVINRFAEALFGLASQYLETQETGDRIKKLEQENDLLRNQLQEYPRLTMEVELLRDQQKSAMREIAEANRMVDQQKFLESQNLQERFTQQFNEKLQLTENLESLKRRITEVEEAEGTIARLNGSLLAREREVNNLQEQMKSWQEQAGQSQVLEQQLKTVSEQLHEAQETIVKLQAQQTVTKGLVVDEDIEVLRAQLEEAQQQILRLETEKVEKVGKVNGRKEAVALK